MGGRGDGYGRAMNELAPGVFQIPLLPRDGINAYLIGDVLVDAGIKGSAKKVLKAVEGRTIRAHAITHAHVDHVGGSKQVADALGVPFWCGALDAPAVRAGEQVSAAGFASKLPGGFPKLEVARELREGDELTDGFTVVDVPGHSPGHVAFHRASDGVAIIGDVFTHMNLLTTVVGLHLPPNLVTPDPAENRRSAKKVAGLSPQVVGFGHGPVLREAAPKLQAFVSGF